MAKPCCVNVCRNVLGALGEGWGVVGILGELGIFGVGGVEV